VASPISADVAATDVSTPGVKPKSLTGFDLAGNQTTVACPFVVAFNFLGFLEPLPQASIKRGSTVPVKFRLGDAAGQPISDAAAQALIAPTCFVRITFDGVDQPACAAYDTQSNRFQYDLKTSRTTAPGSHAIGIRVSAPDGSGVLNVDSITVLIRT
jgi:hypothetical protein